MIDLKALGLEPLQWMWLAVFFLVGLIEPRSFFLVFTVVALTMALTGWLG